jgi:pimeloyl-ACP methyl ester carboxylesterase
MANHVIDRLSALDRRVFGDPLTVRADPGWRRYWLLISAVADALVGWLATVVGLSVGRGAYFGAVFFVIHLGAQALARRRRR